MTAGDNMGKIVFFAPQPNIADLANKVSAEFPDVVDEICYIRSSDSIIAETKKKAAAGADIIIARGLQALMIQAQCDVSLVTLSMTAQEVAVLVDRAKKLCPGKERPVIALIGAVNFFPDLSKFNDLFGVELREYLYHDYSDWRYKTAREAIDDGADAVIGGLQDLHLSHERGVPAIYAGSTEESIRIAFSTAATVRKALDLQKKYDSNIEALMRGAFSGFILFGESGAALRCNGSAGLVLGMHTDRIIGSNVSDLIPGLDIELFRRVLSENDSGTQFVTLRNHSFAIMMRRIILDGEYGVLVSFKDTDKDLSRTNSDYARGRISFSIIRTSAPAMKRAIKQGYGFSRSASPLLICAEAGTPVLKFSQCVHYASEPARYGKFVPVDAMMWATPQEQERCLLGSGSQTGENTGAAWEAANGTLFINGIEYLHPSLQLKMLFLSQYHSLPLIDGGESAHLDIRLIVRSYMPLSELINSGKIMPELMFRLAAMAIEYPPLRDTRDDIPDLAAEILQRKCTQLGRYTELTPEALDVIKSYSWPGNHAQLESFIERLAISAGKSSIGPEQVSTLIRLMHTPDSEGGSRPISSGAAGEIIEALSKHGGNRQAAARELGISTTTLWRRMKEFGISPTF